MIIYSSGMTKQTRRRMTRRQRILTWLVSGLIFILAGVVIAAQWPQFAHGWHVLRVTNPLYGVLAFGCVAAGISGAALAYRNLAVKPTRYWELLHVAWSGMFVNRLLPAGVGGMGLFVDHLVRRRHSIAEASGVVLLSSLLTSSGHGLLIGTFLVLGLTHVQPMLALPTWAPWVLGAVALALMALLYTRRRRALARLQRIQHDLLTPFWKLVRQPRRYAAAQGSVLLITCGNAAALTLAMYVSGVELGFADAVVVLAGGVAAGALTPTPGGLVGTEAGLAAAMTLYGAAPADALSAVLLYRLASFWTPFVGGIIALVLSRRRGYI